jgi:malonyl-CoA O-methyltransferase
MTRKQQVAAAFSAAAATYDEAAEAQVIAADRLVQVVRSAQLPDRPRVLEVGCGTGILTRRLLPVLGGDWLVTDLSPAMVKAAGAMGGATFRVMDAEAPDATGPFDLIVSNLAAQWFADLPCTLGRLAGLLAPGGRMAISTLGAGTFAEWRAAHERLGLDSGIPSYPHPAQVETMLPGLRVLNQPFTVRYDDARTFVRALKAIGAGTPRPGHRPLSPAQMRKVLAAMRSPADVTYDLMIAIFTARQP